MHVSTNAMPLNSCMMASTHLAKVIPPDADITPGDASSEESPAGIAAHCPIMLQDSILMTSVCGDYNHKCIGIAIQTGKGTVIIRIQASIPILLK